MDYRQLFDPGNLETIRTAMENVQAQIWTCEPGIIVSFNAGAVTASVQPTLQGTVHGKDGAKSKLTKPVIPDVPVIFPRGGGYTLTFPVKAGDECTLHFCHRNIDAWWQLGGVQAPMDARMHDLSDAFCTVGPMSQAKRIQNINTTHAQFRSDDGLLFVELDAAGKIVTIKAPTKVVIDTPIVEVTGVIAVHNTTGAGVAATITGSVNATQAVVAGVGSGDQVSLQTHTHLDPQGGSTAPPTPGT